MSRKRRIGREGYFSGIHPHRENEPRNEGSTGSGAERISTVVNCPFHLLKGSLRCNVHDLLIHLHHRYDQESTERAALENHGSIPGARCGQRTGVECGRRSEPAWRPRAADRGAGDVIDPKSPRINISTFQTCSRNAVGPRCPVKPPRALGKLLRLLRAGLGGEQDLGRRQPQHLTSTRGCDG